MHPRPATSATSPQAPSAAPRCAASNLACTFSSSVIDGYFGFSQSHLADGRQCTGILGLGPVKYTKLNRPHAAAALPAVGEEIHANSGWCPDVPERMEAGHR